LHGLRDPFAAPAENVLAKNGISQRDVLLRLQPFISLDPSLLILRARTAIDAPASVSVSLDRGVLWLGGAGSHEWIISARNSRQKLALAGIDEIRTDRVEDRDLEALRAEIEAVSILFHIGSSSIGADQARLIDGVIPKLRQWVAGAAAIGRVPLVKVVGHADRTGTETANAALSNQRARHVMEFLAGAGIPSESLTALGRDQYDDRNVVFMLASGPDTGGRERP
jgi:OOP family OmpA-OmpF porin